jgi:hypothetical protein
MVDSIRSDPALVSSLQLWTRYGRLPMSSRKIGLSILTPPGRFWTGCFQAGHQHGKKLAMKSEVRDSSTFQDVGEQTARIDPKNPV